MAKIALVCISNSQGLRDYTASLFSGMSRKIDVALLVNDGFDSSYYGLSGDIKKILSTNKYSIKNLYLLLIELVRSRYDIVHMQGSNVVVLMLFIVLKRLGLIGGIYLTPHSVKSHWKRPIYNRIYKWIWQQFDGLIFHTENDQVVARNLGVNIPIKIIPHGTYSILLDRASNGDSDESMKDFFSTSEFKIGFVGYIRDDKRLDLLLDAMQSITIPIKFLIAGKFCANNISKEHISGVADLYIDRFLDMGEIVYAVKNLDLIVLPYDTISESGILHLAYSSGTKVLMSDLPSFLERNIDGLSYYFKSGDCNALFEALNNIICSNQCSNSDTARLNYLEHYSWESIALSTIEFYESKYSK